MRKAEIIALIILGTILLVGGGIILGISSR